MVLKIHNTLSGTKETFEPVDKDHVRIYACGPTVYNFAHIGNARMAVVNDLLVNVLRTQFNKVTYVSNITDIDDKIIDAAHELNEPIKNLTTKYTKIYNDDMGYHFMNCSTYEQISLGKHLINAPEFLKDELICQILFHADEERPLSCELPTHIEAEITYTEPGVKGDTATNTLKPATIDTGVEIRVPLFIDTGDIIKVDTRKKEYTERVKK